MSRVAVVGAGWAGLAAAAELARAGRPVDVYEAARQAGGRARRVELDGGPLDNGQHILLGAYRETLRMIALVGGDESRLLLRLPLELAYPGRFALRAFRALPAPLHLLAGLMAAQGLSVQDKLAAVRFITGLAVRGFRVDPDVSVGALLDRHRQPDQVRRYLWEPLCVAALNTEARAASAQVFASVLQDAFMRRRSDSDLLIPRADLSGVFPDLALAYLEARGTRLRLGVSVTRLANEGAGMIVECPASRETYAAAICAVPPARASAIIDWGGRDAGSVKRQLDAFDYEPIVTCYLRYPASVRLARPMIGLQGPVGQWAFDRGALGGEAGLVAVVVSAAGQLRGLPAPEMATTIDTELRQLMPDLPAAQSHRVITEKRATFRCSPGLERPVPRTPMPGLFLAGDHLTPGYPATLEGAVRSGVAAARAASRAAAPS
jgi:squalene-associated FAD-dependent desaturase